jgi:hypothetical protein
MTIRYFQVNLELTFKLCDDKKVTPAELVHML